MKTSNKLLFSLIAFGFVLFFYFLFFLVKSGNKYKIENVNENSIIDISKYDFEKIKVLKFIDFKNVKIFKGDTTKLVAISLKEGADNSSMISINSDTLVVERARGAAHLEFTLSNNNSFVFESVKSVKFDEYSCSQLDINSTSSYIKFKRSKIEKLNLESIDSRFRGYSGSVINELNIIHSKSSNFYFDVANKVIQNIDDDKGSFRYRSR